MEKFNKNLEGHRMLRKIVIQVKDCTEKEAERWIDNLIYATNRVKL